MVTMKAVGLAILLTAAPLTLWAQQNNAVSAVAGLSRPPLPATLILTMTGRPCSSAIRATR